MPATPADEMSAPAVRSAAQGLFGARLPLADAYAVILADRGVTWGLLGPAEAPVIWERHLLNCAVLASLIPAEAEVCDLGSGAGLPGLVLAIARPDLRITCVEPLQRRARFLSEAAHELGLEAVTVAQCRAEAIPPLTHDVVTARALAPLPRLLPMAAPLLRPGGMVLAIKGAKAEAELDEARPSLQELALSDGVVLSLGEGEIVPPTRVVRLRKTPTRNRSEGRT